MDKNKKSWLDYLPNALWAYKITVRTATPATPYSLVFREEDVLPLEIQLPSSRVDIHEEMTNDGRANMRILELDALNENRLEAQIQQTHATPVISKG